MCPNSPTTPAARWTTIAAAAEKFDLSADSVRRMIRRGEVTAVRIGPRCIRVDLNSIHLELVGGGAA